MRKPYLLRRIKNLSYRSKLLLTYALIVTIPLVILSTKYYYSSKKFVSDFSRQNLYSIVKQNNEIIDSELSGVEDGSLAMIADQNLYEQYLNANPNDEYAMLTMEKRVNQILTKYFPEMNRMYAINLITSYANIGTSAFIPYQEFDKTALYRAALEGKGGMKWVPTFSFDQMFDREPSLTNPPDYSRLLSGVRLLQLYEIQNNEVIELKGKAEMPVLVITYKPEIYSSRFSNALPSYGASFLIFTPEGDLVSGTERDIEGTRNKPSWLDEIAKMKSGTLTVMQDGKPMIVCFDTSEVTGWISAVTISPEKLMASFLPEIEFYTLYLALFLLIVSLLLAYIFASSITRPIHQLLKAIKKTGDGEFDTKIPVESYNEMGFLIHRYNQMNTKINNLIEENYIVKLREKETQIMSLNIQLNPHFLYNTLNIMNWTALENNQKELSSMIVSLSSMLQYTSENKQDLGDLNQDLNWLKHYIYITDQRFEGKFTVSYDIAQELYAYTVPKLFLQPFVENAIVHGFAHIHSGGIIRIRGWIEDDQRIFTVEDNGKGIPEDRIANLTEIESDSIGIQNVDKRIKLIYGELYGVTVTSEVKKGTVVKVTLPLS
ncbi:histidine kinase [Paenibacillus alkaliterrae]|uniref:cache domain-containing sensor histidine kinase n=1 Tax=Paenibacillus alkaliterrae TaxID=320909 RepID=UPI001F43646F|nr:sensor histidine kinase [Paenibacillus alkaliterrae]MCF2940870.1 histidine kinase [Paenibacillus alkaliterrae]